MTSKTEHLKLFVLPLERMNINLPGLFRCCKKWVPNKNIIFIKIQTYSVTESQNLYAP